MNKIMVLPDGETWSMLDGCMIITLSDEELNTLCHDGDFSDEVKIQEQRTLSSDDVDWFDVCADFYHACGGADGGCGNLQSIDEMCEYYASYFEEEDADDTDDC